jgi:dihydroorotase
LGSLEEGQPADIIIFDPDKPVKINRFKFQSKSQNTPFDGFNLQGENLLTMVQGKIIFKNNSFKV